MANSGDHIRKRFEVLDTELSERGRRLLAAVEAECLGPQGVAIVSTITSLARSTIYRGIDEIKEARAVEKGRVRKAGGGRKKKEDIDPALLDDLKALVEPNTRGDPMQPLLWTSKSLRKLSKSLEGLGHKACPNVVRRILRGLGFTLQSNRKTREGTNHPDRDEQFRFINKNAKARLKSGDPVLSVDTKKKELVGDFKNNGREWAAKGSPEEVRVHDFVDPVLGRAVPYGVYDVGDNSGWVSVGTDHDTSAFAVNAIRRWWQTMGQETYRDCKRLMITADGGGSNGYRVRLWKVELQKLADEIGVPIMVCHFPPGTSKWNKIEHRLFSFITQNWRGKPLRCHRTVVELIGSTTTQTGLTVRAELDENKYPKGVKISDAKLATVNLKRHRFHGDWNYTISPAPA